MRTLEVGDFKGDMGATPARVSSGEVVALTEGGRPVAELSPVRVSTYARLRELDPERPVMMGLDAYQVPSRNLSNRWGIVSKLDD